MLVQRTSKLCPFHISNNICFGYRYTLSFDVSNEGIENAVKKTTSQTDYSKMYYHIELGNAMRRPYPTEFGCFFLPMKTSF